MTLELSILLKATAVLSLGLAAARLARSSRASVRHLVLACTFGALLALPIAAALAPAMVVRIPIAGGAAFEPIGQPAPAPAQRHEARTADRDAMPAPLGIAHSTITVLRMAWAGGAMLFLAAFAVSMWTFSRTRRCGFPWTAGQAAAAALAPASGVRRPVAVLLHEDVAAPVTYGVVRAAIVLPPDAREWTEPDLRRAFVHELEHVRRGDWLIQLGARAICAAYWFHPLVWIAWRQLGVESERACDDAVVTGSERTDYAEQLVTLAERLTQGHSRPVLSMASRSDLSVRVKAVLDRTQVRGRAGAVAVAAAICVATVLVGLVAPLRAVAVSRDPIVRQPARSSATTTALNAGLLEAAQRGDLSGVTELLNSGGDANAVVPGDGTPLIVAARKGHMKVVRLLLDRGADPNLAVPGDGNALIMAAREGHTDIVTALLDRGASIDQIVPEDENALIQASAEGRLEVVRLLVSRGASVNARAWAAAAREQGGGEWRTPLSMARKHRHDAVVAYLVSAGAVE